MGFTAIWISPITYNFMEPNRNGDYSYHGYWQQDLYRLNPAFGSAEDLRALTDALHARGMWLMVDVVVNHNGWNGNFDTIDYSRFRPFNDRRYYHDPCAIDDYNDERKVQECWLYLYDAALPDLRTEDRVVQDEYNLWIQELIGNYSIDGLRVDTVKHVGQSFWRSFSDAAGVYVLGENYEGDPIRMCPYQNSLDGLMAFGVYFGMLNFLNSTAGDPNLLAYELWALKNNCRDVTLGGSFSENHDLPRFASYTSDLSLQKNVIAFTILQDGVPIIYNGQEQAFAGAQDPYNREALWLTGFNREPPLYNFIALMNQIRNRAIYMDSGHPVYQTLNIQQGSHEIVLRKGFDGHQIITVISNLGARGATYWLEITGHGLPAGTQLTEIVTCQGVNVDGTGSLWAPMNSGEPRVMYPTDHLHGSGICYL